MSIQKAERDLRKAISTEVSRYAGVTLSWSTNPRTGEAIIRMGDTEKRVHYPRSPSRWDRANAIGRARRALRDVGVADVATPVIPTSKVAKRKPKTNTQRITELEEQVATLVARITRLEAAKSMDAAA